MCSFNITAYTVYSGQWPDMEHSRLTYIQNEIHTFYSAREKKWDVDKNWVKKNTRWKCWHRPRHGVSWHDTRKARSLSIYWILIISQYTTQSKNTIIVFRKYSYCPCGGYYFLHRVNKWANFAKNGSITILFLSI